MIFVWGNEIISRPTENTQPSHSLDGLVNYSVTVALPAGGKPECRSATRRITPNLFERLTGFPDKKPLLKNGNDYRVTNFNLALWRSKYYNKVELANLWRKLSDLAQ